MEYGLWIRFCERFRTFYICLFRIPLEFICFKSSILFFQQIYFFLLLCSPKIVLRKRVPQSMTFQSFADNEIFPNLPNIIAIFQLWEIAYDRIAYAKIPLLWWLCLYPLCSQGFLEYYVLSYCIRILDAKVRLSKRNTKSIWAFLSMNTSKSSRKIH